MKFLMPAWIAVAVLCGGGCATEHYVTDAKHPEIAIKPNGDVTYRGKSVDPEDLPGLLRRSGFTREDTINIHYPDSQNDFRVPRRVMTLLRQDGFPRTMLVGDRKSYSHVGREGKKDSRPQLEPSPARTAPRIRYK